MADTAGKPVKACNTQEDLNATEKDIFAQFEGISPENARALAVSDFVVDVPSIKYLNKGFRFYSRQRHSLEELVKFQIKSRWIAIVGDYNAGKTFFSCLMMDRPIASDLVIRTPGISVMLSPKEEAQTTTASQTAPPKPQDLNRLALKLKKAPTPEDKKAIETQIAEIEAKWKAECEAAATNVPGDNEFQCAFATLDTAGDDRPCSFADHADVRANEMVKRALIVQTAQTMIFVTSKFDRDSQEKLSCLMSQMARQRKPASRTNRIIVVHNGIDATEKSVLQNHIEEVKQCYSMKPSEHVQDWGWEVDKDHETGVTFYKTEYCLHLFLVNHAKHDHLNGIEHNLKTMNRLKVMIHSIIPSLMSYPIFSTLVQNLMTQLPLFLKEPQWVPDYSRFFPFEEQLGVTHLVPAKLPTEQEDPEYWASRTEETTWVDEIAPDGKLEEIALEQEGELPPFELAKVRVASGVAISDTVKDLEGTWFVSDVITETNGTKKSELVVVLNGVNFSLERLGPENFVVRFYQRKGELHLRVKIPAPTPPKGCQAHAEAPHLLDTWGQFTCKFPEEFILDGRSIASFYDKEFVKVVDGALHLTLAYSMEEEDKELN